MRDLNPIQDSFIRLDQGEQLRQRKELDRAQSICESLLREHPDYMAALHTLGLIFGDKGNYEQALNCLVRAVMLNPRSWNSLTALSGVYLKLKAPEMATQALEQARAIRPQDSTVLVTLGEIYREEREYELAQNAFRHALALAPDLEPAISGLGWVSSCLGQNAEAATLFESLVKRGLSSVNTLLALIGLPASVVSIDLLAEMDKLIRDQSEEEAEFSNSAAFVRAKALADLGRHAEAWQQLASANRELFLAKEKELAHESKRRRTILHVLRTSAIKAVNDNEQKRISLFILGPSRSGKTTMETLVAALDGVKRGYENPSVENAIRRTFQTAGLLTSRYFEKLPLQLYPLCREIYLEELSRRADSAKVFTNTHPARIYDAALMMTAFPNVRFIFVKRKLEDILFRMYQQKYQTENVYSYNLLAARDYVIWYYEMVDVLAHKLPDFVRVIHYEDMVADPAAALRTAADLCGLPMTDKPLPVIGDDRGCAEPYRQFMTAELGN